ncbi:CE1759 family FMN reductase [Rhodococcus sp. HNM0569]|uniref:CE1759 family FMN reductase n=1 Tax=Rhodococcus sp. HNM0569 TaxID=2716340 RepID=UPI00146F83D9|nr:CE1759 family FMN reductase [Rhodococcus sp. HNM0569]NLU83646.1 NADH-dependent FMN reductase [Rhodococcus sp. HNM0569]
MTTPETGPMRLVVVNAGTSDPSSSRMLADKIAAKTRDLAADADEKVDIHVIELRSLAGDIAGAIVSGFAGEKLQAAIDTLAAADGVVVSTPVYKAGVSGLFKSFVDVLDNDLLLATPIALAATAGTARHALVPDEQLRPLFAYMRAMPVPTSVFAAPDDWGHTSLSERIERVAGELVTMMTARVRTRILDQSWGSYQHTFGGNATRAEQGVDDIALDTDLMRLAAGGTL